jgi:hypothetical protein
MSCTAGEAASLVGRGACTTWIASTSTAGDTSLASTETAGNFAEGLVLVLCFLGVWSRAWPLLSPTSSSSFGRSTVTRLEGGAELSATADGSATAFGAAAAGMRGARGAVAAYGMSRAARWGIGGTSAAGKGGREVGRRRSNNGRNLPAILLRPCPAPGSPPASLPPAAAPPGPQRRSSRAGPSRQQRVRTERARQQLAPGAGWALQESSRDREGCVCAWPARDRRARFEGELGRRADGSSASAERQPRPCKPQHAHSRIRSPQSGARAIPPSAAGPLLHPRRQLVRRRRHHGVPGRGRAGAARAGGRRRHRSAQPARLSRSRSRPKPPTRRCLTL